MAFALQERLGIVLIPSSPLNVKLRKTAGGVFGTHIVADTAMVFDVDWTVDVRWVFSTPAVNAGAVVIANTPVMTPAAAGLVSALPEINFGDAALTLAPMVPAGTGTFSDPTTFQGPIAITLAPLKPNLLGTTFELPVTTGTINIGLTDIDIASVGQFFVLPIIGTFTLTLTPDVVPEQTAALAQIKLRDTNGDPYDPLICRYRLDCRTTNTELVPWVDLPLSADIDIVLNAQWNRIIDPNNGYEDKELTVSVNDGFNNESNRSFFYRVENLRSIT